jgi:dTDP-4-amino-4,6-dideoxygalactose transaminase
MEPIYVTKPFLPDFEVYQSYLKRIWDTGILTNQGPLAKLLEDRLREYLGVPYLNFMTNGTVAIQLALNALGIGEGEIVTTPFSYVATTSTILWERCTPVFADIDPATLCMDAEKAEAAITEKTRALLAVHVFGYPCDVDGLERVGQKHGIPVIYDAAHAMGCRYRGRSLVSYGDAATLSFHATKLFHTAEGGALICKDEATYEKASLAMRFGHNGDDHLSLGINAKSSELNAAMGLSVLPELERIIARRKAICDLYDAVLTDAVIRPLHQQTLEYNYAYYPIILSSESQLLNVIEALKARQIFPRRYFYPSLNLLPYLKEKQRCPVSEDIAVRVMTLPLYPGLADEDARRIAVAVKETL